MIATPTTLIALLRTIAHGWTTEALAERTREIHELGRELHTRIGVMGGHLDKVGRSLKGAVEAYNSAVARSRAGYWSPPASSRTSASPARRWRPCNP